jgi:GDPmannose 4,6-dehydratase
VNTLRGNAAKAERVLRWRPEISFEGLIAMMVDADLKRVAKERS